MPLKTVRQIEELVCEWFLLISLWCAQVTLTPEESKITVFNNETPNGLKSLMEATHCLVQCLQPSLNRDEENRLRNICFVRKICLVKNKSQIIT